MTAPAEPTLHEALLARGLTHEPSGSPGCGVRVVLRDGVQVFRGRASAAWEWLRAGEPSQAQGAPQGPDRSARKPRR